ncbi:ribonuclease HI [candidate division KSB1 bacterium]|nr:ribonuclease HI [candidate division KSB1 bacterium]
MKIKREAVSAVPETDIILYTDGACPYNPGPGGWGVVIRTGGETKIYSGRKSSTTCNQMELTACIQGLNKIAEYATQKAITVYSDSTYVVDTLNNKWYVTWQSNGWRTSAGSPVKNKELWTKLLSAIQKLTDLGCTVSFHHVKGHSGNPGNEFADSLANSKVQMFIS